MNVQTTDLRLEGSRRWRNTCIHPAEEREWRYLPALDFITSQLVCERCGEVLAGGTPGF